MIQDVAAGASKRHLSHRRSDFTYIVKHANRRGGVEPNSQSVTTALAGNNATTIASSYYASCGVLTCAFKGSLEKLCSHGPKQMALTLYSTYTNPPIL